MTARLAGTAACAVFLAACGGADRNEQQAPQAAAPAPSASAPAAVSVTPPAVTPAQTAPSGPAGAVVGAQDAPTAADSAAATREDVSPEWKQRERAMAGTEQCLAQAAGLEGPARARVEASCRARAKS